MSYAVDITAEAQSDLAALPLPVAEYVERQIHRLAQDPAQHSKPVHFPLPLKGQLFEFDHEFEQKRYFVRIVFQFSQDEQTIHILYIATQVV